MLSWQGPRGFRHLTPKSLYNEKKVNKEVHCTSRRETYIMITYLLSVNFSTNNSCSLYKSKKNSGSFGHNCSFSSLYLLHDPKTSEGVVCSASLSWVERSKTHRFYCPQSYLPCVSGFEGQRSISSLGRSHKGPSVSSRKVLLDLVSTIRRRIHGPKYRGGERYSYPSTL